MTVQAHNLKKEELMKHLCENTLLEKQEDLQTIVVIAVGKGNNVHVQTGDAIEWTFDKQFTVTINVSGVVTPLGYVAVQTSPGHFLASGGTVIGQPGTSCQSSYSVNGAVVPPNVIIVDNSTDGLDD